MSVFGKRLSFTVAAAALIASAFIQSTSAQNSSVAGDHSAKPSALGAAPATMDAAAGEAAADADRKAAAAMTAQPSSNPIPFPTGKIQNNEKGLK
jgi:hypothetical protein